MSDYKQFLQLKKMTQSIDEEDSKALGMPSILSLIYFFSGKTAAHITQSSDRNKLPHVTMCTPLDSKGLWEDS